MSKHAMPRSQRLGQLKVAATAALVVAFVTLFVGGATGMIGSRDDGDGDGDGRAADVGAQAISPATDPVVDGETEATTAADEPTEVVTDVPPQDVKDAKKLKRSLAWLRRGLADETTFRVGTFNVLGSSHTAKVGGNKRGYASGVTRMGMAYSLINQADLDVIGFQEFEEVQYGRFRSLAGSRWDVYPGPSLDRGSIRDSIAWRTDVWKLVEANSIAIPYFGGDLIRRPVVKLENIESGREVWFFNTHNPAPRPTTATTRTGAMSRSASRSGSPTSWAPTARRSCSPATTTTGPRCSARSSEAPTWRPPTAAATPAAATPPTGWTSTGSSARRWSSPTS